MLKSGDRQERRGAVSALAYLGRTLGWRNTVSLLEASLNDPDSGVKAAAIGSLNWISYNDDLRPTLIESLSRCLPILAAMFADTNK